MTNEELINYQTGEKLDWDRVEELKSNAMLKVKPKFWCEWNFERNKKLGLNVWRVTKGMNKKAWWICDKGHEWEVMINDRNNKNTTCPYCANKKVLKGFNDMWTTIPELASLLANPEDGYKYMQHSSKKLAWRCSNCERIIEKVVYRVRKSGFYCSKCKERFHYNKQGNERVELSNNDICTININLANLQDKEMIDLDKILIFPKNESVKFKIKLQIEKEF